MPADDPSSSVAALKEAADRAMRNADPRTARDFFQRALVLDAGRIELWMGLAACQRVLGDASAALAAVENALGVEPRFFPALLMKGSLLETLGQTRSAAITYGVAVKLAPAAESLSESTRRALAHGEQAHSAYAAELVANLRTEAGLENLGAGAAARRRVDAFVEAIADRRKIYHQEPVKFHYPGQPAIEFWEREEFPWLEALEDRTAAIRAEVLNVWSEGSPELAPYVNYPPGIPVDQWAELNHSLAWSAYHLIEDGVPVDSHARNCPDTMAALDLVDQPHVPGRSPAAMFSILRPRTRIPPHTGVANTRLVLHLPLIVPEGCAFRVGGETRPWREGEAWVFDDTIEHEAWNDSDKPRAILICDVWSPRLSSEERQAVASLLAALDRFNGEGDAKGHGL
jgi:aspartyl/asparaginyl beta-hydroxylase (cupin superfamily)